MRRKISAVVSGGPNGGSRVRANPGPRTPSVLSEFFLLLSQTLTLLPETMQLGHFWVENRVNFKNIPEGDDKSKVKMILEFKLKKTCYIWADKRGYFRTCTRISKSEI